MLDDDLTIIAGEFSLNTILCNLIDNALFYGITDQAIILDAIENEHSVTISISNKVDRLLNNEELSAIFDPLYQLDLSRTNNQRHGLGLSIVQSLCDLNGFKINVQNNKNNTLTFNLTLSLK